MGKCRQEGDNDAACNEGVLCCQCATASLSPITSDGLSCLFFFNNQYEQSIFSTFTFNTAITVTRG